MTRSLRVENRKYGKNVRLMSRSLKRRRRNSPKNTRRWVVSSTLFVLLLWPLTPAVESHLRKPNAWRSKTLTPRLKPLTLWNHCVRPSDLDPKPQRSLILLKMKECQKHLRKVLSSVNRTRKIYMYTISWDRRQESLVLYSVIQLHVLRESAVYWTSWRLRIIAYIPRCNRDRDWRIWIDLNHRYRLVKMVQVQLELYWCVLMLLLEV